MENNYTIFILSFAYLFIFNSFIHSLTYFFTKQYILLEHLYYCPINIQFEVSQTFLYTFIQRRMR